MPKTTSNPTAAAVIAAVVGAAAQAAREAAADPCPVGGAHCPHHADGSRPCCRCGASAR